MKNFALPVVGLSLVLFAASCKKSDFNDAGTASSPASTNASTLADTVGWKSSAIWDKADQGTFSVHYFTIQDSSITSDIADNGLVLVFKKNGTNINALPFEEGSSTASATDASENSSPNYWYHQVANGSLLISCDVYKASATPDVQNSFKYFILTAQKLQSLQTSGYTTEKLMGLNYAEAATLLKTTN